MFSYNINRKVGEGERRGVLSEEEGVLCRDGVRRERIGGQPPRFPQPH